MGVRAHYLQWGISTRHVNTDRSGNSRKATYFGVCANTSEIRIPDYGARF